MKKLIPVFLLFLASAQAVAQDRDSVVVLPEVVITAEWMINEQVDKAFAAKFPESYDIIWKKLNKDYLIRFMEVDVKHQSLFRKNGSIKYDIIYVNANHLPKNIAAQVQQSYPDYNITHAARIERGGQDFWIVNLEGMKSYVVIRFEEDDISEVKRIVKSK